MLNGRRHCAAGVAREMTKFENVAADAEEVRVIALAGRSRSISMVRSTRPGRGDMIDDAVAHLDGFVNVVRDEKHDFSH